MLTQSLIITLLGMGSVFFFLFLMVCSMYVLQGIVCTRQKEILDKIALAIIIAQNNRFKK